MNVLLGATLEQGRAPRVTTDRLIHLAMEAAPKNTRAYGRSELVRHLLNEWPASATDQLPAPDGLSPPYVINWSIFQVRGHAPFSMPDPFKTYLEDVRTHLERAII